MKAGNILAVAVIAIGAGLSMTGSAAALNLCGQAAQYYAAMDDQTQLLAKRVDGMPIYVGDGASDGPGSLKERFTNTRDQLLIELHNFSRRLQEAESALQSCD